MKQSAGEDGMSPFWKAFWIEHRRQAIELGKQYFKLGLMPAVVFLAVLLIADAIWRPFQ